MNHPSGILTGMDETDIALEAGWEDDPHRLVAALMECGFLEKTASGAYALHDWQEHQVWAAHAEERKARAKHAAHTRWNAQSTADGQLLPRRRREVACLSRWSTHSVAPVRS